MWAWVLQRGFVNRDAKEAGKVRDNAILLARRDDQEDTQFLPRRLDRRGVYLQHHCDCSVRFKRGIGPKMGLMHADSGQAKKASSFSAFGQTSGGCRSPDVRLTLASTPGVI